MVFKIKILTGKANIDDTLKQLNTKLDDVELPEGAWNKNYSNSWTIMIIQGRRHEKNTSCYLL